jgi:hypothetical protein
MKIKLLCCWLVSLKQGTQISPAIVRSVYAPRTYYHTLYAERTVLPYPLRGAYCTFYYLRSRSGTRVPTSHAQFTNSTWPFVTLPDFERRGVATIELAEVMSMVMVPFVTDDTREDWEAYSVANQGWFQEGLDVRFNLKNRELFGSVAIPEEIYAVKGLSAARELGPGPYPWVYP